MSKKMAVKEVRRGNNNAAIVVKRVGKDYEVKSSVPEAEQHGCCSGSIISYDTLMGALGKGHSVFYLS